MNSFDGLIRNVPIKKPQEAAQLSRYHSGVGNSSMQEKAELFEMKIVEEFNTDVWIIGGGSANLDIEIVAPKYKLSMCVVHKSMSTVMTAIFCLLFDEDGFRKSGKKLLKQFWPTRFCKNRNEAISLRSLRSRFRIHSGDNWMHIMLTRDPIDRLLSGFVDQCISVRVHHFGEYCNGCKANITCFLIKEYERMVTEVKKDHFAQTREDLHFFPQNWRCELFRNPHRYFIRYSANATDTMLDDLFRVFRLQKVGNSTVDFIRHELTSGRTKHSTIHSYARKFLEERLRSSNFLMEYVIRMFYHDFRLFHYELPKGFK